MNPVVKYLPAKATGISGLSFLSKIKISFMIVAFAVIFLAAIIQSVENRSIEPLINEVGGRIAATTLDLNQESLKVIAQGKIIDTTQGIWKGLWASLVTYSGILSSLYFMLVWIMLLSWMVEKSFVGDSSRWFYNTSWGIILFIFFQIVYLLFVQPGDITKQEALTIPFVAFWNFFKAFAIVIAPFAKFAERFAIENNQTIVENITNGSISA